MFFRFFIEITQPREIKKKRNCIFNWAQNSRWVLPDASLKFGFDNSVEGELQNMKISIRCFYKGMCLLLHARHHFMHIYLHPLGKKHSVCGGITMRRAGWKGLTDIQSRNSSSTSICVETWQRSRQEVSKLSLLPQHHGSRAACQMCQDPNSSFPQIWKLQRAVCWCCIVTLCSSCWSLHKGM